MADSLEDFFGQQTDKVTKQEVNYRVGSEETACAFCANFVPEAECLKVKGVIAGTGFCDLFAPKEEEGVVQSAADPETLMAQLFGGTNG